MTECLVSKSVSVKKENARWVQKRVDCTQVPLKQLEIEKELPNFPMTRHFAKFSLRRTSSTPLFI
jgi:hypothetical protein